jgi:hypothetical protein
MDTKEVEILEEYTTFVIAFFRDTYGHGRADVFFKCIPTLRIEVPFVTLDTYDTIIDSL